MGYKKDDVVALFMENSIEFVACWIGLSKLVSFLIEILIEKIFTGNCDCMGELVVEEGTISSLY